MKNKNVTEFFNLLELLSKIEIIKLSSIEIIKIVIFLTQKSV